MPPQEPPQPKKSRKVLLPNDGSVTLQSPSADVHVDVDPIDQEPPDRVVDSWLWISDTRGYGSVSVTFVTLSFMAVLGAYAASVGWHLWHDTDPFDPVAVGVFWGISSALYFGRKLTEAKLGG